MHPKPPTLYLKLNNDNKLMLKEINMWADFWRYEVGVNVIPADSVAKKTSVKWKDDPRGNWQIQPIPESIHDEWKKTFAFKDGMAIICGKVHHNKEKSGLFLCAIDADNKKAIDVFSRNKFDDLAQKTLVEMHDNPNKAHFYFYTRKPMPKKSSDAVTLDLLQKIQSNEIPALEMKGDGTHGIMYCTPSPHKDGSNYKIVGKRIPEIYDGVGEVLDKICEEYSLGRGKNNLVPMNILLADETRVIEGSNRHEAIMRYAESILRRYPKMEDQIFNDIINAKNNRMCVPPLTSFELTIQIDCAKKFILKQIEEENKMREEAKYRFNTEEFWFALNEFRLINSPTGRCVKCLDCGQMIDATNRNFRHDGHKIKFILETQN